MVNIAGGHNTGVREITSLIKTQLEGNFKHRVKIIDIDDKAKTPMKYNDNDYDFQSIAQEILNQDSGSEPTILLVCGCYSLYDAKICDLSSLKVFLDSDGDRRLINLINSEKVATGKDLEVCINKYLDYLRPEMNKFIEPSRTNADLIIPSSNEKLGAAMIVDGIVKVIENNRGCDSSPHRALYPHLDFTLERMEIEKERYYDLT